MLENKHLVVRTAHLDELPPVLRQLVHLLLDKAQVSLEKPHVYEAILVCHDRSPRAEATS